MGSEQIVRSPEVVVVEPSEQDSYGTRGHPAEHTVGNAGAWLRAIRLSASPRTDGVFSDVRVRPMVEPGSGFANQTLGVVRRNPPATWKKYPALLDVASARGGRAVFISQVVESTDPLSCDQVATESVHNFIVQRIRDDVASGTAPTDFTDSFGDATKGECRIRVTATVKEQSDAWIVEYSTFSGGLRGDAFAAHLDLTQRTLVVPK